MENNEKTYLDLLNSHLDKELEHVRAHAKWYKESSTRNRRKYFLLRVPAIILGIILPILITIQSSGQSLDWFSVLTIVISSLVAILTSLDTFFQYGKSWVDERTAELAMYRLIRKYERERLRINSPSSIKDSIDIAEKILLSLQEECEQIVGEAVDSFMKRSKETESKHPSVNLLK